MKQIKLCMTDIDDTFIGSDKTCPMKNVEAVKAIRKNGIKFGIATGRPYAIIPRLFTEWGLEGEVDYIVGSNGAEVFDCQTQKKKEQFFLTVDQIQDIEQIFQPFEASLCVYEGTTLLTNKETIEYKKRCESVQLTQKIVDFTTYIQHPYPKMLIISSPKEQKRMIQHYEKEQFSDFKLVASSSILTEVIHPSLSKVKGILQVCDELHIEKDEVLCFGDEMNDLEMVSSFVGVSVSNAIQEVTDACYYHCASCDEGGVGQFLFDHLL